MKFTYILFFLIYSPFYLFCGHDDIYAFVTNTDDKTVSAFNTEEEGNLSATLYYGASHIIRVGENPKYLATSPDGLFVYVVNQGNGTDNGTVSIIDVSNIDAIPKSIEVGKTPVNIVFAGVYAFVPNSGGNTVSVINTTSKTLQTTITVQDAPSFVAKNKAENRIYVSNKDSNSVSIINVFTHAIESTVTIPPYLSSINPAPEFITFDIDDTAYITCAGSPTICTITAPPSSAVHYRLSTPVDRSNFIAIYKTFAYICCSNTSNVLVKNTLSLNNPPIAALRGRNPVFVTFYETLSLTTEDFIVFNGQDNVIVNIPGSGAVSLPIRVQNRPTMLAKRPPPSDDPSSKLGYVPNNRSKSVSVIDMEEKKVISTVDVGRSPYYVSFASKAGFHNTISVSAEGTTFNKFLTQTEFTNRIAWESADIETEITKYSIYRNSVFIGSVLKGLPYVMDSHNSKEGKTYSYSVVGQNAIGETLAFGYITMVTK